MDLGKMMWKEHLARVTVKRKAAKKAARHTRRKQYRMARKG